MKSLHKIIVTGLFSCILFSTACKKEAPTGSMTILMTDAPAGYSKVNIDVKQLRVHYSDQKNGDNGWITLATKAGIYDLLTLRNNVTTMLADGTDLPPGKISQIRLILGEQNSVVTEGGSFPLKVPSAYTSGLKIDVNSQIQSANHLQIILDFDAASSVHQKGNTEFELHPVIKVKSVEYN
jgi:hypothetical protein